MQCVRCGMTLTPGRGRPRLYCTQACRQGAYRSRLRARRQPATVGTYAQLLAAMAESSRQAMAELIAQGPATMEAFLREHAAE